MNNGVGFNPEQVNFCIESLKKSYEELIILLGDGVQNNIVNELSDKWASNQAISFFNDVFKTSFDSLLISINAVFERVISVIISEAQLWANRTCTIYIAPEFVQINKMIDVSLIRENVNGVRGIDLESSRSVLSKLPSIVESTNTILNQAQQSVLNCGFIGGSQGDNLYSLLGSVKTNVQNSIQDVISQFNNSVQSTITGYSDTAGLISNMFASIV